MRDPKRVYGFTFFNIAFFFFLMRVLGIRNDLAVTSVYISISLLYYLFNIYFSDDEVEAFLMIAATNLFGVLISFNTIRLEKSLMLLGLMSIFQFLSFYLLNNVLRQRVGVMLIGDEDESNELIKYMKGNRRYDKVVTYRKDDPILKDLNAITGVIHRNNIKEIAVLHEDYDEYIQTLFTLKIDGIKVYNHALIYEAIEKKINTDLIERKKLLTEKGFDLFHNSFQRRVKRSIDILLSVVIGVLTSPIMLLSALLIKLESKGPVFFIQQRIGLDNKPFNIIKFRSMKVHNEEEYSKYADKKDNRITKFGKVMRKTRIDELPQILNVLKGDMSFIGPRAEWDKLSNEYEKDIPYYSFRHSIKPGLTGWAQVSYPYGASADDMREKLKYDLYYIKYQSLSLDIKIIFKTIKTVLFGKGQ